jgi:hypothetical protein
MCTVTSWNTQDCDQKKLLLKIFLFYMQLLIIILVLSTQCVFHIVKYVSVGGHLIAVDKNLFSTGHTCIQQMDEFFCNGKHLTFSLV